MAAGQSPATRIGRVGAAIVGSSMIVTSVSLLVVLTLIILDIRFIGFIDINELLLAVAFISLSTLPIVYIGYGILRGRGLTRSALADYITYFSLLLSVVLVAGESTTLALRVESAGSVVTTVLSLVFSIVALAGSAIAVSASSRQVKLIGSLLASIGFIGFGALGIYSSILASGGSISGEEFRGTIILYDIVYGPLLLAWGVLALIGAVLAFSGIESDRYIVPVAAIVSAVLLIYAGWRGASALWGPVSEILRSLSISSLSVSSMDVVLLAASMVIAVIGYVLMLVGGVVAITASLIYLAGAAAGGGRSQPPYYPGGAARPPR